MRPTVLSYLVWVLCAWLPLAVQARDFGNFGIAIVAHDQTALRSAARDSAKANALLWQGEALEVRSERLEYLQVYDHQRERGGFVRANLVRRLLVTPESAGELLAVVRFLRDRPGAEPLGIGYAAAFIKAASADRLAGPEGSEVLEALGDFAERLAERANSGSAASKSAQTQLSAHLEVAARYGVAYLNHERDGKIRLCYDGFAFRKLLATPANPTQEARAILALTQPACVNESLPHRERLAHDQWRLALLARATIEPLPAHLRNRVLMRRAGVQAALAYQLARDAQSVTALAASAVDDLALVTKADFTDEDELAYQEAAIRVNASRWASLPARTAEEKRPLTRPTILTTPGEPGQTCVVLVDAKHDATNPLLRRCTYAQVWQQSAVLNREGNALALAVQPIAGWRELWVFRKGDGGWTINILPPAPVAPELGYAEFAGWVPGGSQMLVAREAISEGKPRRSFEVVNLDTLATVRQASEPSVMGPFQRWQDPEWKRLTVSLR